MSVTVWIQATVCAVFLLGAVYEFLPLISTALFEEGLLTYDVVLQLGEVDTYQELAYMVAKAINYFLIGALGIACLAWPSRKGPAVEEEHPGALPPAPNSEEAQADAESGQAAAPAPAPVPPRRMHNAAKLHYLTHMKTFLTFIVVTLHILVMFSAPNPMGLGTTSGLSDLSDASDATIVQMVFSYTFQMANLYYFMAAFYFISGIFCPKSLDRKGFRVFVLDKLMRLGGPFVLYNFVLGPLLHVAANAFAGQPLRYNEDCGPTWFVFWLLNFSILYAIIAQFMPVIKFKMPHPVLMTLGGFAIGLIWFGLNIPLGLSAWFGFWNNAGVAQLISMYIPFFAAGIIAGRSGWLETIVSRSQCTRWGLRVALIIFLLALTVAMVFEHQFVTAFYYGILLEGPLWIALQVLFACLVGWYAVGMTCAEISFFHEFLNFNTKFMGAMGAAAYAVYIIHPWIFNLWIMVFVEILKAAHVPIVFISGPIYQTIGADGEPEALSGGMLWGGQTFVFVLTQLTVWPAAYYLRKLPILNKML